MSDNLMTEREAVVRVLVTSLYFAKRCKLRVNDKMTTYEIKSAAPLAYTISRDLACWQFNIAAWIEEPGSLDGDLRAHLH